MLLKDKTYHTECRYYASDQTALFRQYRLSASETLGNLNQNKGYLLYLAEGSIEISLGRFSSCAVPAGRMLYLPQNISFHSRAISDCHIFTCVVPNQIPLCNRYDLLDLQRDVATRSKETTPPPPIRYCTNI